MTTRIGDGRRDADPDVGRRVKDHVDDAAAGVEGDGRFGDRPRS
jgi:hypothetical protein